MSFGPILPPHVALEQLGDARIIDARPAFEYVMAHLPGAVHADLDEDLSSASLPGFDPANGGRHPLPDLQTWIRTLNRWGLDREQRVLIYDQATGADAAARLWWMLRASGFQSVALIDGGFKSIIALGPTLTAQLPKISPVNLRPMETWGLPLADRAMVERIRRDADWMLLDVRAPERYRGEVEPLDPVAGHISGAWNLHWAHNLEADGNFKTPEALKAQYLEFLDGCSTERLVVSCGSGVTACHTLLALERAGLAGASLYVGSWSEWCRHPEK